MYTAFRNLCYFPADSTFCFKKVNFLLFKAVWELQQIFQLCFKKLNCWKGFFFFFLILSHCWHPKVCYWYLIYFFIHFFLSLERRTHKLTQIFFSTDMKKQLHWDSNALKFHSLTRFLQKNCGARLTDIICNISWLMPLQVGWLSVCDNWNF